MIQIPISQLLVLEEKVGHLSMNSYKRYFLVENIDSS